MRILSMMKSRTFQLMLRKTPRLNLRILTSLLKSKLRGMLFNLYLKEHLKRTPRRFLKISTSSPNLKLKTEESFEESLLDHNLNRTLDDNQDILEDDTKAQKDNDARFTVAKNVVFVGAKK